MQILLWCSRRWGPTVHITKPVCCLHIRLSVRLSTKICGCLSDLDEIWYVTAADRSTCTDECCSTVCHVTHSKVKVTSPSKLEILLFLMQMVKLGDNIDICLGWIFDVCVTWLWTSLVCSVVKLVQRTWPQSSTWLIALVLVYLRCVACGGCRDVSAELIAVHRVATHLENLEKSGNLRVIRESQGI